MQVTGGTNKKYFKLGRKNIFVTTKCRDENAEALVMLLVAAAVGGIVIVFCGYVGYRLVSSTYYRLVRIYVNILSSDGLICSQVRRYVFKIQDPKNNFRMDKKVKCRDGNKKSPFFTFLHEFSLIFVLF